MNPINFFSKELPSPVGHDLTPTKDGTFTFQSHLFQENCHSTAGAYQETLYNYVHGCKVPERLKNGPLNIFEVGFGPGLGPIATFVETVKIAKELHFFSTELDENLILWLIQAASDELNQIFPFNKLKKHTEKGLTYYFAKNSNRSLTIFLGNCSQEIKKFMCSIPPIHGVYQDPFSPKKNPELWTKEWFQNVKTISHPNVLLSTYSASASVKQALESAGWSIETVKGFGNKRSSIRAKLN